MELPLLPMPVPQIRKRPPGTGRPPNLKFPDKKRQLERLDPTFQSLIDTLDRHQLLLRQDPAGIAPERALVLEVAGSIDNLVQAISYVNGLEFLAEEELTFAPDTDFYVPDTRVGKKGRARDDKPVAGRVYLAMPDIRALRQLVGLWNLYKTGMAFQQGLTPWRHVFEQLREIRAWGPRDRVPPELTDYLAVLLAEDPSSSVRLEVELWSYRSPTRQRQALVSFQDALRLANGSIVYQASISEIAYEAVLIDLPAKSVYSLVQREEVTLALCDDIMLIRPQSMVVLPVNIQGIDSSQPVEPFVSKNETPIVGLMDGVPIQGHRLLEGRLSIDDPDNLDDISVVSKRQHGTEMASLIIHGDRHAGEFPLRRPIYLRPVLYAPDHEADERTQQDRLLIDTIYRAILRMRSGDSEGIATAPTVFIVNLSLGDSRRPFTGPMSPWGRLLDYLAARFGILFIVSAGNILTPLDVATENGIQDIDIPEFRQRAILSALSEQCSQRTLLSPAEALNVLTIGAWYSDNVDVSQRPSLDVEPYIEQGPNITSALGLGHRKVIKPDLFMPGGRERVYVAGVHQGTVTLRASHSRRYGLKVAVPDSLGRLDREGMTSGTSAAAALATRSAHLLFDSLVDAESSGLLTDADPAYYGVVVKALLVHTACWDSIASVVSDIHGPVPQGRYVEYRDRVTRLLGYGTPDIGKAIECGPNRATLVGYGEIVEGETGHVFRIPLPSTLERVTEPRSITLTLAWFSPVNVRRQVYRRAKLEIRPNDLSRRVGVDRARLQPSDKSIPRGSLFHVRYEGSAAVEFVDDGYLEFTIFCREQGGPLNESIRYGVAVTIEAGEHLVIYEEVRRRLAVQARVTI